MEAFLLGILVGVLFSALVYESQRELKRITKLGKREDLSKFKEYLLSHSESFRRFSWRNEDTVDPQNEPLYDISEFKIKGKLCSNCEDRSMTIYRK
jgi:hypothetical protein